MVDLTQNDPTACLRADKTLIKKNKIKIAFSTFQNQQQTFIVVILASPPNDNSYTNAVGINKQACCGINQLAEICSDDASHKCWSLTSTRENEPDG